MKYQIGLVLAKSGRPADAIVKFKAALEIEPWHAEATQAIVAILLETHRAVEAITYAERAAQATNSQNAHVLAMLADVYAAAGQPEKAIKAFRLAMRRALLQDPSIIPGLQQAIDKLTHASAVPASTR